MDSIDKILSLTPPTSKDVCLSIAKRVRQRRLEMNLTQVGLCKLADINISTYRRFERTGEIALDTLARIALAMNKHKDFDTLFSEPIYNSIDDVVNTSKTTIRKRGKKNE
ncbi:MAG: helix-turn-helix transcriptional regulator [Bacteroidales bacterium]|nr:helix-turn-helix transcriptional regulator [Bacteroidales bacterium]